MEVTATERTEREATQKAAAAKIEQKTMAETAAEFCKHIPECIKECHESDTGVFFACLMELTDTAADAQAELSNTDTAAVLFDMYNVYRRAPYKPDFAKERAEALLHSLLQLIPRIVGLNSILPAFESMTDAPTLRAFGITGE